MNEKLWDLIHKAMSNEKLCGKDKKTLNELMAILQLSHPPRLR